MTVLSYPTLSVAPSGCVFSLIPNTQTFVSPLNQTTQTLELPGARWQGTYRYDVLIDSDARILKAWLASLRGSAGRFYAFDYSHKVPAGIGTGSPLVNGAGQTGASLNTDGWTANITGILKAGDYISVNGELKIITADASSNSGGAATLSFEPPLRSSPADNATITTIRAPMTAKLKDDNQDSMYFMPKLITSVQIEFIEAFA